MELERLNQQQFDRFREFIYDQCGIRIDGKKVALLSNRVRRRLRAGDFDDFDAYYRFLTSPAGSGELESFLDAITTNETFFFRTEKHFEWLTDQWVPELASQYRCGNRPPSLRIWSAGCATGAEPYSIAICLAENLYRLRDWSLKILGTDISEETLHAAREGSFKSRAVEAVTLRQRRRYFHRPTQDGLWRVRPGIRELVEFQRHNLIQPPPETAFDCIFIRNVLIYFDAESKRVVVKHLLRALVVGGYLVVGPSEGLYGMLDPLKKISPFLYQKVDDMPSRTPAAAEGDAQQ